MKWLPILISFLMTARAAEIQLEPSDSLQRLVEAGIQSAVQSFANQKLTPDQLAVTLVDLRDPGHLASASHRGGERIYPASVIKLFYLEAAHRWMEDGKIDNTPELRRAMSDMIIHSYNEATHYVVDILTGTTSGPELPPDEMARWMEKRDAVNRYFHARGFTAINANQKPWCEGPYGRERAFVGASYTNRNMLTTEATARLLAGIALHRAITPARSAEMLDLLRRDPSAETTDPDDQAHGFTAPALPRGTKLWSKAGWTSQTRHDAAYIELENGARLVLVIFTVDHANERGIIPAIARPILQAMGNP